MQAWLMAGVLLLVTLAGCAGEETAPEDSDETPFDDKEVEVTADTGGVRGVVLNDAIVPVAGALVELLGTESSQETDEQGRFAFSKVVPGTYFLSVSKPLHQAIQTQVHVVAGVKDPEVLKVQLVRDFQQDPFLTVFPMDGFFTCTQAGLYPSVLGVGVGYGSSPCHAISPDIDLCNAGALCLDQNRVFETELKAGWQSVIYEMTWEASASGTSQNLGVVISEDYETRAKTHNWANYGGPNPVMFRINVGEEGPGEQSGPIPAEGVPELSMFQGVRASGLAPGLALDQDFTAWFSMFHYAPAPEDWSFMAGSPDPFKP